MEDCEVAEAATDYYSPCCEREGMYAHFLCKPDGSEKLIGFQCTGCGENYDVDIKSELET